MSSLLLIPMIYLAAVLETWLAPRWQVRGITPDLVALAALAWLSRSKSRYGFLMVALAGFAADFSSSAPLGLGMATFAVVGYAIIFLRQNLHLENILAQLLLVGLGATAICLLQSVVLRLVDRIAMPWQTLAERAALVGLYTTAVAIPLLIVLRWFGANRPSPAIVDQPAAIR